MKIFSGKRKWYLYEECGCEPWDRPVEFELHRRSPGPSDEDRSRSFRLNVFIDLGGQITTAEQALSLAAWLKQVAFKLPTEKELQIEYHSRLAQ